MLNKCSNPPCAALFHTFEQGRLFSLEPDPTLRSSQPKWIKYYWLCRQCASTMTLRLGDYEDVIAVDFPSQLHGMPNIVSVTVLERKRGLLLQGVPCQLKKGGPERVRNQIVTRPDVA